MDIMRRRMPSCRRVVVLLSEAMDRQLGLRERLALRVHVMMCLSCGRYQTHLKLLRAAVRYHARLAHDAVDPLGAVLSPAARERLQRTLRHAM